MCTGVQVVYLYFVDWAGQVCTGSLFVLCGWSWPGVYRCTGSLFVLCGLSWPGVYR